MKVRMFGVLVVMVALSAACGSSSTSTPDTAAPPDVDVQAATSCKTMETVLTNTAGGKAISGPDAQKMLADSGALIHLPDGRTPTTADATLKWYDLGVVLVALFTAVSSDDTASITGYTSQARALCATIPEAAQQTAKYTPTTA